MTRTLTARPPAPRKSAEPEEVYIARKDKADVRFTGTLVHEERSPGKDRWTQLELWELENGDWVAASIGMSDRDGEVDIGDAIRIWRNGTVTNSADFHREAKEVARTDEEMAAEALAFWGYTWLAKKAADALGWSYVEDWK